MSSEWVKTNQPNPVDILFKARKTIDLGREKGRVIDIERDNLPKNAPQEFLGWKKKNLARIPPTFQRFSEVKGQRGRRSSQGDGYVNVLVRIF